jgi:VanZ family protein
MVKKNILSIIVALIILYLSLASSDTFDSVPVFNIPYYDKLVHFCMYSGFMAVLILESRNKIKSNLQLFLIALIPLSYGILMEILQGCLTTSRSASSLDVVANLTGITASVLLWLWVKRYFNGKIKS